MSQTAIDRVQIALNECKTTLEYAYDYISGKAPFARDELLVLIDEAVKDVGRIMKEMNELGIFDLTPEQARSIGGKLTEWGNKGHG